MKNIYIATYAFLLLMVPISAEEPQSLSPSSAREPTITLHQALEFVEKHHRSSALRDAPYFVDEAKYYREIRPYWLIGVRMNKQETGHWGCPEMADREWGKIVYDKAYQRHPCPNPPEV